MSNTDKYRNRLITLLKELFQLDKPELDFGLYKIMHAKSGQISSFLENDLLKEIQEAFGDAEESDTQALKAQAREQLVRALGETAIDETGKLAEAFSATPAGKQYMEAIQAAEAAKDTLNAEAEVYDHLYRFFERYYDNGDFMSRRYYARESDSRAAPYAVPYDGREVYLHWANKDRYYIKSSEYLSNYTFELSEAIRQESVRQQQGKGEGLNIEGALGDTPHMIHFRIVEANEGEHGNIKASSNQKRFFIIHNEPLKLEKNELVIQFQYRSDSEKPSKTQDKTWQKTRLEQAEESIFIALKNLREAKGFLRGLQLPAPTDSQKKRTLLGKHLQKYSARNTMDYFIHKDLGGFLRRELDFYIKNEIMRLDDLENAEAPKVEQYLVKIRVLRRVAHQLIAFLGQLEDFQKKLWLKKKFVTETQYCITLDQIPASFYTEIAANDRQREEWVELFSIDEVENVPGTPGYSEPLTVDFLRSNPYLPIDTAFFNRDFTHRLISELQNLDKQINGVSVHSDNYQASNLLQKKYTRYVDCEFSDPPYNTGGDAFIYRDNYQHSSWLSMVSQLVSKSRLLLSERGLCWYTLDFNEAERFMLAASEMYGADNCFPRISWQHSVQGKGYAGSLSLHHNTVFCFSNTKRGKLGLLEREEHHNVAYGNPDNDPRGPWRTGDVRNSLDRPNLKYKIPTPSGLEIEPPEKGWRWSWETLQNKISTGEVVFTDDETKIIRKIYLVDQEGRVPESIWFGEEVGTSRSANAQLKELFGLVPFGTPKPTNLIERCICLSSGNVVSDYFAGSGSTGHAVMNLNKKDNGDRKFLMVEVGEHFDSVMLPRIKKIAYTPEWSEGKPTSRNAGSSLIVKYIRLESYEDTLNNLTLKHNEIRDGALDKSPAMQRDYLLNYCLEVETEGSQSLLNIADFRDPTAYKMWIKKPRSDERVLKRIDLIETFNWLIGLWVEHFAAPQSFKAEFTREKDADLPEDQNTRLICTRLKQEVDGNYWFRLVEGYTLRVPGDKSTQVSTLIIWRKLTDDPEKDNAALQKYLETIGVSTRERTYEVIYVNGSHTLPNPVVEGEQTKVRLIEEAFHQAMWAEA